jgi:hypothetical protein
MGAPTHTLAEAILADRAGSQLGVSPYQGLARLLLVAVFVFSAIDKGLHFVEHQHFGVSCRRRA